MFKKTPLGGKLHLPCMKDEKKNFKFSAVVRTKFSAYSYVKKKGLKFHLKMYSSFLNFNIGFNYDQKFNLYGNVKKTATGRKT